MGSVSNPLSEITFVRRVTAEGERGEGRGGAGGKRRLEREDEEDPRFGVTPAELGDHLNEIGRNQCLDMM